MKNWVKNSGAQFSRVEHAKRGCVDRKTLEEGQQPKMHMHFGIYAIVGERGILLFKLAFKFESAVAPYRMKHREIVVELVWTDKLSVGNAIIDSEHRNLLNMVSEVVRAIRKREIAALLQAFKILENWLCVHVANEGKIAKAINFPFAQQIKMHQYALIELQHLRDELIAKEASWSESAAEHYVQYLKNWIVDEHILKSDRQMKLALQKYPYNFFPD